MVTSDLESVCLVDWDGCKFVASSSENGKLDDDIDFDNLRRKLENRGWTVKTTEVVKVRFGHQ